jgi:hypothetical protein
MKIQNLSLDISSSINIIIFFAGTRTFVYDSSFHYEIAFHLPSMIIAPEEVHACFDWGFKIVCDLARSGNVVTNKDFFVCFSGLIYSEIVLLSRIHIIEIYDHIGSSGNCNGACIKCVIFSSQIDCHIFVLLSCGLMLVISAAKAGKIKGHNKIAGNENDTNCGVHLLHFVKLSTSQIELVLERS